MQASHSKASLILILVLLLFSAFFSGSETALISFRKTRLKHLVRKGHKGATLVDRLLRKTDRLLAAILVGNNLVNVAASVLTGVLAIEWLEPHFGQEVAMLAATLVMTFLLLIFALFGLSCGAGLFLGGPSHFLVLHYPAPLRLGGHADLELLPAGLLPH
jgi:Mg2+/Co2+ transporter CorB